MTSKITKRIEVRLRSFKMRGNSKMVFLHRPSCQCDNNFVPSPLQRGAGFARTKYVGEANQ